MLKDGGAMTFDLEKEIDKAYKAHVDLVCQLKERQQQHEQEVKKKQVEEFQQRLNQVLPTEVQKALGIKVDKDDKDQDVMGSFEYKGTSLWISYGPYAGGPWGTKTSTDGVLRHHSDKTLLNDLLIQLGHIRQNDPGYDDLPF